MERIVISTWQSIYKKPAAFFQNFGMVIGDEAHQFKAKSLTSIMEKCTEADNQFSDKALFLWELSQIPNYK